MFLKPGAEMKQQNTGTICQKGTTAENLDQGGAAT